MPFHLSDFKKLDIDDQNKYLENICHKFLKDDDFSLILDFILESFAVDETLKGIEMREDRYLKACQREGIEKLKNTLSIYNGDRFS